MKFSSSRLLVFPSSHLPVLLVAVILFIAQSLSAQVVEIPDPNLESAIRSTLQLPVDEPITQQHMETLTRWKATDIDIIDLTGIEYAVNSVSLDLGGNDIHDIQPLADLTNLTHLSLWSNEVEDISHLANLTNLTSLELSYNNIADISPLANLINLQYLRMKFNLATDFSPVQHLNLIVFEYDEICDVAPQLPSARERIETRTFPSVFRAWNNVVGYDWHEVLELHDLHWYPRFYYTIDWDLTSTITSTGLSTQLAGPLSQAREVRQRRINQNPNMIFLGGTGTNLTSGDYDFPPDSDFLLRDANGQILTRRDGTPLVNFVKPEVQDLIVNRIIAFDRCGLYDGVMFDEFNSHGTGFSGRDHYPYTDEQMIAAYYNILSEIRKQVRDDFLIIINVNETKPTRFAEFINGIFMETAKDYPGGYSRPWLMVLEDTLSWAEQHLREPRINCLEGEGMSIEPPDGPNNLRWMRLFTTLSLTHSDGYVLYTTGVRDLGGPHHDHLWHDFWEADLGQPVGKKTQLHQNIDGLFIREFTNGWAVYNRSGNEQTITLPRSSIGVSSNKQDITHRLPDLDGEIYLRKGKPYDLNRDGTINVLDLILVAQHFGTTAADINGDGTTNIFDLTLVVQQFN